MNRTRIHLTQSLILLTTLILLLFSSQLASQADVSGQIAYVSDRDGNFEIYAISPTGGETRNLTNHVGKDYHPSWSPDGKSLLFLSTRDGGDTDVFVMSSDGQDIINVSKNDVDDNYPKWSPDSQKIAFSSSISRSQTDIFIVGIDGENLQRVNTNNPANAFPSWSPDSRELAFISLMGDRQADLFATFVDGSNTTRRLTSSPETEGFAVWSPLENIIALQTNLSSDSSVYLLDPDTNDLRLVTEKETYPFKVTWSPDGKYLAFPEIDENSAGNITLYDIETSTLTQIQHDYNDWNIAWASDSQYLATISSAEDYGYIFTVDVETNAFQQLTDAILFVGSDTPLDVLFSPLIDWQPTSSS